jgi:transglutaminase-like putative cysteine protease
MTASIALLALLLSAGGGSSISPTSDELLQLARTDLRRFAETVTAGETTTRGRASKIVAWYATNLDWTATDYQRRTVDDILARRGGNCDELAAWP